MKVSLKGGPLDGKIVLVEHFSEILAEHQGLLLAYSPTNDRSPSGYPVMEFTGKHND